MIGIESLIKELVIRYFEIVKPVLLSYLYQLLEFAGKMVFLYGGVFSLAGLLTLLERKISALIQDRVGPERANIWRFTLWGLFHPLADGIKMIMKEDFVPKKANKILFTLAPIITVFSVLIVFVFIPFGNYIEIAGQKIKLVIIDTDISVFLVIALSSLTIYGIFTAGFFSSNTWGMIGSLRAVSQMISYEIITLLSILPVIVIYGSSSFFEIMQKQADMIGGIIPKWGIFLQPLSFLLFITASLCENKRTPFDVVECESEIIGYFIEYSSMRFGAFMFAEYIEIVFFSMLITIFFLGGWHLPFLYEYGFKVGLCLLPLDRKWVYIIEALTFAFKTFLISNFIIFIRWTLPRFRFDQIMRLAWKNIMPLALLNLLATVIVLRLLK